MANQGPWVDQSYYGNTAPYAFSYNPSNSSDAYNKGYWLQASQASRVAGNGQGAYSQDYRQQSQGYGNNYNYAPSISSSLQRADAYGGIAEYSGAGAGARAGVAGSVSSRWSVGSGEPREKQDNTVPAMMDKGQFSLNETTVARNIKEYRQEYRGNLWTKGSRARVIGRMFIFFIMVVFYLLIGGILGVALYIRPPSASFMKPGLNANQDVQFSGNGLTVPLQLNISIWNPTFIAAVVKRVHVDLLYPLPTGEEKPIGNGTIYNIWIQSNDRTNFTFPIDIDYDFAKDPQLEILVDIAKRCAQNNEGLAIKAKAMVAANILGIGVSSPTVPININIACPFDQGKLQGILQQVQGTVGNIFGVDLLGPDSDG